MLKEDDNTNKKVVEKRDKKISNIMRMLQSATQAQLEELEIFIKLYIT
jgi:predicted transcriptional regulator